MGCPDMTTYLHVTDLAVLSLSGIFVIYAIRLYKDYSDQLARKTFKYSISYLALLFAAILIDHYL